MTWDVSGEDNIHKYNNDARTDPYGNGLQGSDVDAGGNIEYSNMVSNCSSGRSRT